MSIKKTLGGDRLGSGKRMQQELHNYERSNHDLSEIIRTTAAPGVLIPFLNKVMLPGDTFDIDLDTQVMTQPTQGPLFASFKMQLDVFLCPIRLYQAQLHNNKLKIGNDMSKIKLPQLEIECNNLDWESDIPLEQQQINQGSLLAYLGVRGLGESGNGGLSVQRRFNAIPYLAYWDIYKNYYANKQEEIGAFVDYAFGVDPELIAVVNGDDEIGGVEAPIPFAVTDTRQRLIVRMRDSNEWNVKMEIEKTPGAERLTYTLQEVVAQKTLERDLGNGVIERRYAYKIEFTNNSFVYSAALINTSGEIGDATPRLNTFPLDNIDEMREDILQGIKNPNSFIINYKTYAPYGSSLTPVQENDTDRRIRSVMPMQGLAVKTYQSDIFNNWLNTEWIDGDNGITAVSAIDVSDGLLTIDALNLAKKVYAMLNRIAISGGSYYDWIEAVYSEEGFRGAETPVYMGGISKMINFQQVVNTAESEGNPLGSLGGRGVQGEQKGGKIVVKTNEPAIVIGLLSLTPIIDYYQGNDWAVNLDNMGELHAPALDGIGFQDLVTDQMAFWETKAGIDGNVYKSAGKTVSWVNYMTSYNKIYGNFADSRKEMFMTLARRYEPNTTSKNIKDLTTYIDPAKFNYAFAYVDRSAQNFWIQIATGIQARRKISAKQIPMV